jgi:ethanolamine ammonia-lyase small subunit
VNPAHAADRIVQLAASMMNTKLSGTKLQVEANRALKY